MRYIPAIEMKRTGFAGRLFSVAFLLLLWTGPAPAQEILRRLFFTEQQRQDLDRRRQANLQETAVVVESTESTVNSAPTAFPPARSKPRLRSPAGASPGPRPTRGVSGSSERW